ncbi:MAG: peptidase domain protein [Bacteroidetes bacterium]|nr:peptidase domain protein [Bacteroidota bacterium]
MQKSTQTFKVQNSPIQQALYQKTVLENGIRVISETIPYVRSISAGIWANVGSRDESGSENGLTHFLEHMVFKGTKRRSVREIAQSLESLGGYLNAFTTKEQTCFYARVLDEHIEQAVDVLSDLVQHATFKREELEKEKFVVIEELKNAEDDPEDIIHDYFEKAIFPTHPLGFPIIGNEANVRAFTRQDLQLHVAEHYTSPNIVIAAAGNIEHSRLVRMAQKYLSKLPRAKELTPRVQVPTRTVKAVSQEYGRQIQQAHVCIGTVGYGIRHKDRYPLMVMNALLGEGMSSRLYQTIREKHGLAYSVYSFVNLLSDAGSFGACIGTDKKNITDATELMHLEFGKLRSKPVPLAELDRTKSQIKGTMMLGLENMSGRMMRLGSGELYFNTFTTLDTILKKVNQVTPEAIRRVANDLLRTDRLSTIVIRPA